MLEKIIDSIVTTLQSSFKDIDIKLNNFNQELSKNSFFLIFMESITENLGMWSHRDKVKIRIVYREFKTTKSPEGIPKFAVYDKLKNLFSSGYLEVGERKITIIEMKGGTKDEELSYITNQEVSFYLEILADITDVITKDDEGEVAQKINLKILEG
ncbi:phage tail terminator family protein [Oceanirhabdus sp. W0125-5]|uniref:phage tail terminator family protein n=1 Tax=Oceanirhabdus sp. W0125-5 TaxID=2999116 RepID=UPI0022F33DCE|nr:hypothetical protein [Oceanirhabdus sp. W0125-5]WBW96052.1 hypothetical protein OW730_20510 [Oceanirhabdus sp. W0125-5]